MTTTAPIEAMPGFTFGCDPELFVVNPEGVYVTAEGLIPGDKVNPHKVEYGAIQVDGMAAEFNIDPVDTFKDFKRNIKAVMRQLKEYLPEGYSLSAVPAVVFSEEEWAKAPAKAKILGCSSDFNAWTGATNKKPKNIMEPTLRTAAGHLHIGWTNDASMADANHLKHCSDLVKQLDWYLGGWSLKADTDPTRRLLYGKAGAMRYKPYGVEYRVLSNFWLTNEYRMQAVWDRMQKAIWGMRGDYMPEKYSWGNMSLVESINESRRCPTLESTFSFPLRSIRKEFF